MIVQPRKQWIVYLGVRSGMTLQFTIKDKSGLEFGVMDPGCEPTSAVQQGVDQVLKSTIVAETVQTAIELLDPILDRVLNVVSFRLLRDVIPIALELIEDKPSTESREWCLVPQYSPLGNGRFQALGFSAQGGMSSDFHIQQTDKTDVAIRWFLRGLKGSNPLESFIGYWLAIEALVPDAGEAPLTMRCCGYRINECPNCRKSTLGAPGMARRLRTFFLEKLGKDNEYFRRIWELRNYVFHGSGEVFSTIIDIASKSFDLRKIAVTMIKETMAITSDSPPHQSGDGLIIAQAVLIGSREPAESK